MRDAIGGRTSRSASSPTASRPLRSRSPAISAGFSLNHRAKRSGPMPRLTEPFHTAGREYWSPAWQLLCVSQHDGGAWGRSAVCIEDDSRLRWQLHACLRALEVLTFLNKLKPHELLETLRHTHNGRYGLCCSSLLRNATGPVFRRLAARAYLRSRPRS